MTTDSLECVGMLKDLLEKVRELPEKDLEHFIHAVSSCTRIVRNLRAKISEIFAEDSVYVQCVNTIFDKLGVDHLTMKDAQVVLEMIEEARMNCEKLLSLFKEETEIF